MDITAANLDILFRQAQMNFQGALTKTPVIYPAIATTLPMGNRQITNTFLDRLPMMREWRGNRVVHSPVAHARTITAKPYEHTYGVSKWDIIDENLQLFSTATVMQAEAVAKQPDQLNWEFLKIAASALAVGYDGVPVYSTAHPLLGGVDGPLPAGAPATQSNLALNTALTYDNYVAQRQLMGALVGADGAPLSVAPDTLMVPPQLEGVGKLILEAEFESNINGNAAAPQSNVWKGSAKLLVNPWASLWPNNWWLLSTNGAVKPFVDWTLTPGTFTPLVSPSDPNVFMAAEFLFGVESRKAASESVWWLSRACTSAATYVPA
jgi:phage major head subunit gpT-like protein